MGKGIARLVEFTSNDVRYNIYCQKGGKMLSDALPPCFKRIKVAYIEGQLSNKDLEKIIRSAHVNWESC